MPVVVATVQLAIDVDFAARSAGLQSLQTTFRGARPHFFQGGLTHATLPVDGVGAAPDRLTAHPTDQASSWSDFGASIPSIAYALRCDVYDGPGGKGYVLSTWATLNSVRYARHYNFGPDSTRERGWVAVPVAGP